VIQTSVRSPQAVRASCRPMASAVRGAATGGGEEEVGACPLVAQPATSVVAK
jgi:hypothetical protein